ncbi:MAG: hypothetical protein QNJ82_17945 [Gammaproteobacteria bacterium]|nr:hypothetical protein [Gammaproteobacteria bacterium]
MPVFHSPRKETTTSSTLQRLERSLLELRSGPKPTKDFAQFERELHALFNEAERDIVSEELARLDIDLPRVEIGGEVHHRVLRGTETYTSAAGPVTVTRTLYRSGKAKAISPMELQAGIVEGHWTPLAARQAMWVVSHLTPGEGEALFAELGNMHPSKSSLDRLPKRLSGRWEAGREGFEATLRSEDEVPGTAASVAVSLDGVMAPMKDGERQATRARQQAEGKRTRGPAGHREVGCGTLSFYDAEGERLKTVRMGRMPEAKKRSLKAMIRAELQPVLEAHPELTVVKLADGAKDNWSFLDHELPAGVGVIDFYHAVDHLKAAFDAAYGENAPKAKSQFEKYRHTLRDDEQGVSKVIRALVHLRTTYPRRRRIATELAYFRRHRHKMRYAQTKAQHLPIGSGVVEAACKTLVTQRMKRSGMRWRHDGGQAILTFRSLVQSERFEHGWQLLAQTYRATVSRPNNVVPFRGKAGQ